MGSIGDVFKLIVPQVIHGNAGLSVFFYRQTDAGVEALDLLLQFDLNVHEKMKSIQDTATTYQPLETQNLFDPTDFNTLTPTFTAGGIGSGSGEQLPPWHSWGFFTPRKNKEMRDGRKRVGGLREGSVNDLTWGDTPVDIATRLANFADAIALTLASFAPIIVKRIPYVTPEGNDAYRLPENSGELTYYAADDWQFDGVTTQNSRKD